jgi:hypothetical protein
LVVGDDSLTVQGNMRTFPIIEGPPIWQYTRYKKWDLRGKSLQFSADVSKVGCGCNTA